MPTWLVYLILAAALLAIFVPETLRWFYGPLWPLEVRLVLRGWLRRARR